MPSTDALTIPPFFATLVRRVLRARSILHISAGQARVFCLHFKLMDLPGARPRTLPTRTEGNAGERLHVRASAYSFPFRQFPTLPGLLGSEIRFLESPRSRTWLRETRRLRRARRESGSLNNTPARRVASFEIHSRRKPRSAAHRTVNIFERRIRVVFTLLPQV